MIMFFVAYFTVGLRVSLCQETNSGTPFFTLGDATTTPWRDEVIIRGFTYDFNSTAKILANVPNQSLNLTTDWKGRDISAIFKMNADSCSQFIKDPKSFCTIPNSLIGSPNLTSTDCVPNSTLNSLTPISRLTFDWNEVYQNQELPNFLVIYNSAVLNLTLFYTSEIKTIFQNVPNLSALKPGKDATLAMNKAPESVAIMKCLVNRYTIGHLGAQTIGCTTYNILMVLALITVIGVILARFFMAFLFHWTIGPQLSRSKYPKLGKNDAGYLRNPNTDPYLASAFKSQSLSGSFSSPSDLHTICLVTCYSEDESGIRNTLDSIAATDFSDDRKLLFVICDGLIQGEGNVRTTPDIVVSMITQDPTIPVKPCSYLAIADGEKQHNMAQVVIYTK